MNLDAFSFSILAPAFLAGLLVLVTHVPLGIQVLSRGIVFIDLAIAQLATVGVIVANLLGIEAGSWMAQAAATAAALSGAALLTWTDQRWPESQEAIIGVLFALAASGGMILVANNPHGGDHLQELLAGQILWVSPSQLLYMAALSSVVLLMWVALGSRLGQFGFYSLFALAVTASVQLVGVFLVFASLVVPALASSTCRSHRLALAYAVGGVGYTGGLALSVMFDLPSGPMVVWSLVGVGMAARMCMPRPSSPCAS